MGLPPEFFFALVVALSAVCQHVVFTCLLHPVRSFALRRFVSLSCFFVTSLPILSARRLLAFVCSSSVSVVAMGFEERLADLVWFFAPVFALFGCLSVSWFASCFIFFFRLVCWAPLVIFVAAGFDFRLEVSVDLCAGCSGTTCSATCTCYAPGG